MSFYKTSMNDANGEDDMNKKGYLLDTDGLIAFLRGKKPELKQKVSDLIQQDSPVFMSIISHLY